MIQSSFTTFQIEQATKLHGQSKILHNFNPASLSLWIILYTILSEGHYHEPGIFYILDDVQVFLSLWPPTLCVRCEEVFLLYSRRRITALQPHYFGSNNNVSHHNKRYLYLYQPQKWKEEIQLNACLESIWWPFFLQKELILWYGYFTIMQIFEETSMKLRVFIKTITINPLFIFFFFFLSPALFSLCLRCLRRDLMYELGEITNVYAKHKKKHKYIFWTERKSLGG